MSAPLPAKAPAAEQPPEQLLYARWLDLGTRLGLVVLVGLFVVYVAGWLTPHVAVERLPDLWRLPVGEYLRAAAVPQGWGWLALAGRGDIVNLVGIAILAGCSLLGLAAVLPLAWRRGDRLLFGLCLAEIVVVALAASGWLSAGH